MGFLRKTYCLIIEKLSNLEFELSNNGSYKKPYFRALHFKAKGITFGEKIRVGKEVYIKNGYNLILGERCCIGSFTKIWDYNKVIIGDDFLSAGLLTINDGTHDITTLEPSSAPIIIGDRVWCGLNVTILSGVKIGNDVVIGAGSIVVNDIPDNSVVVGVPAKVIKTINRKDTALHNQHNW